MVDYKIFLVLILPAIFLGFGIDNLIKFKKGHPNEYKLKQYKETGITLTVIGSMLLLYIILS